MPMDWGAERAREERAWVAEQDRAFRASGRGICTHKPRCWSVDPGGPITLGRRGEPVTVPGSPLAGTAEWVRGEGDGW